MKKLVSIILFFIVLNTPLKAEVYCLGANANLYGPLSSCGSSFSDKIGFQIDESEVINGKIKKNVDLSFCIWDEGKNSSITVDYLYEGSPNCNYPRVEICEVIREGNYNNRYQSSIDRINKVTCSLLDKDENGSFISSILKKEIIIETGWESYNLKPYLRETFKTFINIYYTEILAGVYELKRNQSLREIFESMKLAKDSFFYKHKDNKLLKKYSIDQIMIIASLVEKESINDDDKNLIASVILNRLANKMKLQIDSSTIFAITKGHYELKRKLTYQDLKIQDVYNTYYIAGLPPGPISFVSKETIEKVLENFESNYLFYFYNDKVDKLIFSKTFEEHKEKLDRYKGIVTELPNNGEGYILIDPQQKPIF